MSALIVNWTDLFGRIFLFCFIKRNFGKIKIKQKVRKLIEMIEKQKQQTKLIYWTFADP